ncbi:hypothetical protein KI387_027066, partial [Taxus chinensis]
VQPLVYSRKMGSSSRITGPNFDSVVALFGITPPPQEKKEKNTLMLVTDAEG